MKNGALFIEPIFDETQEWVWTADEESAGRAWFVDFNAGFCFHDDFGHDYSVRAVRSGQSSL